MGASGSRHDLSYALAAGSGNSNGYRDNSASESSDAGLHLRYYHGDRLSFDFSSDFHEVNSQSMLKATISTIFLLLVLSCPAPAPAVAEQLRELTDPTGRTVLLPAAPRRVVSLAPSGKMAGKGKWCLTPFSPRNLQP